MSQIIFQLNRSTPPTGEPYVSIFLRQPTPARVEILPFACNPTEPEFQALITEPLNPGTVKLAGARLFNALEANPFIGPHLTMALQTAVGSRHPIFVEIATPAGPEALPWEALCSPQDDFLGLDERWSLARMVQPRTDAAGSDAAPFYELIPPIKIAAVLSCLDISAAGEVHALREAVRAGGTRNIRLLIIVSEEQLFITLRDEVATGKAPEVTEVELIPTDLSELQSRISQFGPHLLHFFCHGSLDGSPHIALAVKEDWVTGCALGSITVEASQFGGFTRRTESVPWLVVLNCCEGAGVNPAASSQSLAWSLVSTGIAPAVVGMREPMVDTNANQVTQALYTKLLSDLSSRIAKADESLHPVDWPRLVVAARAKLAQKPGIGQTQAAASTKEWTLPVIYVRPDDFKLQVRSLPPVVRGAAPQGFDLRTAKDARRAARLEIQGQQALLAALPPDQALALRADAAGRIAELSEQLGVELNDYRSARFEAQALDAD